MLSVIVHPAAGQEVDLDRPLPRLSAVEPAGVRHRRFSLSAPFDKFGSIRGVSVWSRNRSSLQRRFTMSRPSADQENQVWLIG